MRGVSGPPPTCGAAGTRPRRQHPVANAAVGAAQRRAGAERGSGLHRGPWRAAGQRPRAGGRAGECQNGAGASPTLTGGQMPVRAAVPGATLGDRPSALPAAPLLSDSRRWRVGVAVLSLSTSPGVSSARRCRRAHWGAGVPGRGGALLPLTDVLTHGSARGRASGAVRAIRRLCAQREAVRGRGRATDPSDSADAVGRSTREVAVLWDARAVATACGPRAAKLGGREGEGGGAGGARIGRAGSGEWIRIGEEPRDPGGSRGRRFRDSWASP